MKTYQLVFQQPFYKNQIENFQWLYLVHHYYVKKNGKNFTLYLFETSVSMRAKKKFVFIWTKNYNILRQ